MASVARNEPCPCGSGKRYKECHGAIAGARAARSSIEPSDLSWIPGVLKAALAAQENGRLAEAASRYRQVLAADPSNFNATHMLGLVEYEHGNTEAALSLMRRAIELQPRLGTPRYNLRLLQSMPLIEREICADVLPRLLSRVECVTDLATFAVAATEVHVALCDAADPEMRAALAAVVAACGAAPITVWAGAASGDLAAETRVLNPASGEYPRGGFLILLGTVHSPLAWLAAAGVERIVLIVTRDEPCAVIDRIDEFAAAGYEEPGLMCATPELAERLRLPLAAVLARRAATCIDP